MGRFGFGGEVSDKRSDTLTPFAHRVPKLCRRSLLLADPSQLGTSEPVKCF